MAVKSATEGPFWLAVLM